MAVGFQPDADAGDGRSVADGSGRGTGDAKLLPTDRCQAATSCIQQPLAPAQPRPDLDQSRDPQPSLPARSDCAFPVFAQAATTSLRITP